MLETLSDDDYVNVVYVSTLYAWGTEDMMHAGEKDRKEGFRMLAWMTWKFIS